MEIHGTRTVEWLREAGLDDEQVLHAILAHNPANGSTIDSPMDRALFSCDPLTGLITAAALIRPEKKLALVELKSLKKRFKEPSFAKGARREDILTCAELGLELDEFLAIGLDAMKEVAMSSDSERRSCLTARVFDPVEAEIIVASCAARASTSFVPARGGGGGVRADRGRLAAQQGLDLQQARAVLETPEVPDDGEAGDDADDAGPDGEE